MATSRRMNSCTSASGTWASSSRAMGFKCRTVRRLVRSSGCPLSPALATLARERISSSMFTRFTWVWVGWATKAGAWARSWSASASAASPYSSRSFE